MKPQSPQFSNAIYNVFSSAVPGFNINNIPRAVIVCLLTLCVVACETLEPRFPVTEVVDDTREVAEADEESERAVRESPSVAKPAPESESQADLDTEIKASAAAEEQEQEPEHKNQEHQSASSESEASDDADMINPSAAQTSQTEREHRTSAKRASDDGNDAGMDAAMDAVMDVEKRAGEELVRNETSSSEPVARQTEQGQGETDQRAGTNPAMDPERYSLPIDPPGAETKSSEAAGSGLKAAREELEQQADKMGARSAENAPIITPENPGGLAPEAVPQPEETLKAGSRGGDVRESEVEELRQNIRGVTSDIQSEVLPESAVSREPVSQTPDPAAGRGTGPGLPGYQRGFGSGSAVRWNLQRPPPASDDASQQ